MADAKTIYTVTITNGNSDPTFVGTKQLTLADLAVISPTGITTPQTPYAEWVADTTAQLDGSVQIPAWKRSGTQYFVLPAASVVTFTTDIADEAIFYQGLTGKYANVSVIVEDAPISKFELKTGIAYASNPVAGGEAVAVTGQTVDTGLTIVANTTKYTSSDETVATVNETTGAVTGVKAGNVTISCTAQYTVDDTDPVITITLGSSAKIEVTAS